MHKLDNTISHVKRAADKAETAAKRLDAQDGFHLDHARMLIDAAIKDLTTASRQVDRAQEAQGMVRSGEALDFEQAYASIITRDIEEKKRASKAAD